MYEFLYKRYALALYEVAEEKGKTEEYLEQLRFVCKIINENHEFQEVIKHPRVNSSKKKEIFNNIFKGRIEEGLLSFLLILIEKDRILYINEKLNEMEKIHLERNNTMKATVTTVIPMLDEEKKVLKEKLEKQYNKRIIMENIVDDIILGGVHVKVGNDVIDGTVKSKLVEMRDIILKEE